jgi:hypothetical protein
MAAKNPTPAAFDSFATNVSPRDVGAETVIDFNVAANSDYEIQSCVMVNDDNEVVEAIVRFGKVTIDTDETIGLSLVNGAWSRMTEDIIGRSPEGGGDTEYEADLGDFDHLVPHLRVRRENIEEYGLDPMTVEEFADAVDALDKLVVDVFQADSPSKIDAWL